MVSNGNEGYYGTINVQVQMLTLLDNYILNMTMHLGFLFVYSHSLISWLHVFFFFPQREYKERVGVANKY